MENRFFRDLQGLMRWMFMKRSRMYLVLQTMLCILLVILLAAAAVRIYREGRARKAENPLEAIYTPDDVREAFAPIAPLLLAAAVLTAGGLLLGVNDDNADKPAEPARPAGAGRNASRTVPAAAADPGSGSAGRKYDIMRIVIAAAAVVLILAGICNGSAGDVFNKAANICTECIGLG